MSTSCNFQFVGSARKFFLIFGESLTFCMSPLSRNKGQEKKSTQTIPCYVRPCPNMLRSPAEICFFAYAHDAKTSKAALWCCRLNKRSRISAPSTFCCPALQQAQTSKFVRSYLFGLGHAAISVLWPARVTVWAAASVPCRQKEQSFLLAPWNRFYTAKVALCGCWAAQSECASLAWV